MKLTFIKKTFYQKLSKGIIIKSLENIGIWNGFKVNVNDNNLLNINGNFTINCYIFGILNNKNKFLIEIPSTKNYSNQLSLKENYDKILIMYQTKHSNNSIILYKFKLSKSFTNNNLLDINNNQLDINKNLLDINNNQLDVNKNVIDHIYFINLPHRKDRYLHIVSQLKKMCFSNITLIKGIYLPNKPQVGCALSHLSALKDAYINKYEKILILEDDFTFNVSRLEFDKKVQKIYQNFKNWDIIQLSSINYKTTKTSLEMVDRVIKADTTSGYIVNYKNISILFNIFKTCIIPNPIYKGNKFAIDVAWQSIQPNLNWFLFNPQIGYQNEKFYSDIEKYRLNSWVI